MALFDQPADSLLPPWGQACRRGERLARGRGCAAVARLPGGGLDLGRGRLVGLDGGERQVPSATDAVGIWWQGGRQRRVGIAAHRRSRPDIGGRAEQWMGELHRAARHRHDIADLGRCERRERQRSAPERAGDLVDGPGVARRRDQQGRPRVLGQPREPSPERAFEVRAHREHRRQRLGPCELGRRQRTGELAERERVAAGGLVQARHHRARDPCLRLPPDELRRRGGLEPGQAQTGHPRRVERRALALANRDQERDALTFDAPRAEHERLHRRAVEPVGVVDEHGQRLPLGGVREQGQRTRVGREAAVWGRGRQSQRAGQRVALRRRQAIEALQEGLQHRPQAGKGQLRLGLDATRAEDHHPRRSSPGVVEERGLADAGLADHDERPAPALPGRVQVRIHVRELRLPAHKHPCSPPQRPGLPGDCAPSIFTGAAACKGGTRPAAEVVRDRTAGAPQGIPRCEGRRARSSIGGSRRPGRRRRPDGPFRMAGGHASDGR